MKNKEPNLVRVVLQAGHCWEVGSRFLDWRNLICFLLVDTLLANLTRERVLRRDILKDKYNL